MTKWRKKLIEGIEAELFIYDRKDYVWLWAKDFQSNIENVFDKDGLPAILIPAKEGEMLCRLGDYLVAEPYPTNNRKLYPCKAEIFEAMHEKVEDTRPSKPQPPKDIVERGSKPE